MRSASSIGTQRLALDERHDVVEECLPGFTSRSRCEMNLARVKERNDVGMAQVGSGLDFEQEPVGAQRCADLRIEHLDGDVPVVLQVARQVYRRHAAASELVLDGVAILERD